ncbi:non-ribosomal peptide synthetase [Solwaraspora sp. WMMD1047]|uniref:non-ribosomal peptide synthetase n=1 Tax=Solwaraspora sp. WMMD1047 TaxID=3016102 RepID=UPI002415F72E|nr:non-ribosomal peptide synthetase [Solwaraspora sp. WMMD1047]MDG4834255.1 non-ribosomal peptide synthetase [Solwaraspora sp. WMMD1047]
MRCPVTDAFEAVVDAGPDRAAIMARDRVVSFAELDGRANVVADLVAALPGEPADPVVLTLTDPVEMIAAQLGVLKAGRPFVVVNPHFPVDRRREMRQLLGATTVLCDASGERDASGEPEGLVVPPGHSTVRPAHAAGPDDLAYVLFTSGSTGIPKAVAQTRGDMLQNVRRHVPLGVGPTDRVSLISADGVVTAVSNLVIGLLNGAAVAPYSFRQDGVHGMPEWLAEKKVTMFYGFPSFLRQLAKVVPTGSVPAVRLAYIGGEPVLGRDFAVLGRLFPNAVRATGLNSTETGLTRLFQLPPGAPVPDRIPLGGPVDGVDVRTDGDGRIVIRSRFVKPRLWRQDGLVDLAVPGPDGVPEFVTGDRGELTAEGVLFHRGRSDAMVKIRGFRVEPAEVEDALAKLDGVTEVGVCAYPDEDGELELAAVLTTDQASVTPLTIRADAANLLPQPMVPTTVLIRDTLPHTTNGKLDRGSLAALVVTARTAAPPAPAVPAGDDTYARLRAIWCRVLRTDNIGPDDDFFDLGGTSISALSVISRVRKEFGAPVRLAVMFEQPTLRALTEAVDELGTGR